MRPFILPMYLSASFLENSLRFLGFVESLVDEKQILAGRLPVARRAAVHAPSKAEFKRPEVLFSALYFPPSRTFFLPETLRRF
jgi:hypothetical protein